MPATIALGTSTFTMSAMPGTPAIQNTIPMPFFGTTPFAAPGLGIIASQIMLMFGLWWLMTAEALARKSRECYGAEAQGASATAPDDQSIRERATSSHEFDPAEIPHGKRSAVPPPIGTAIIPLAVVVGVNLLMSLLILPRLDFSFLAQERWGATSLAGVAGVWSVAVALAAATATLVALNRARLPDLRASMDAGANAAVLPILSVASLVGFGAVVAALPAFASVRDWVLAISGGPLVSLAVAINVLAALTGSASGGLTIALDALGSTYLQIAQATGIDPAVMHRIAVIGSGTLDSLPHNGAVVTLLAVCGSTHRESYFDMAMANIVGPIIALAVVIALGSMLGSF
jgi:H+/gluconate symporter-like permease